METISRLPALPDALAALRERPTVSVYETAVVLQVGETKVREAIADGTIRSIRLGRNIRVISAPIRELLGITS